MATRPVTGDTGWGATYDAYEEVSHNSDGTLKLVGSESDGHSTPTTTGYQFFDVDGVSTKVYTKYITGTTAAGDTTVAHGLDDGDDILAVSVSVFNSTLSLYQVTDFRGGATSNARMDIFYGDTNINLNNIGSDVQGQKYRIKIDYIA